MLWPRQICPFGLPNEDDDAVIGDIVAVSIGHFLRVTATDIVDAPLPVQLAGLLRRLERRERSGRGKVTQRHKCAMRREPMHRAAQLRSADRDADAARVVADVIAPVIPDNRRSARGSTGHPLVSAS